MKSEAVKKVIFQFLINFLMLLIFWGGMLRRSFNADTVFHMVVEDADISTNIEVGRYIISLGDYILLKAGVRVTDYQSITMLAAFILFALTMMILQNIFEEWMPCEPLHKIGYCVGLNLVFLNVLFSELLMFGECCLYFGFGYLMAAIAVEYFIRRKYAFSAFILAIAACTYQYTMIFAAVLMAFYLCLMYEEKLSWKAVLHEMAGILLCMAVGVINLLSIKVLEKMGVISEFGKRSGLGNMSLKLEKAIVSFIDLNMDSADILPNLWIPLLFTLGILILIVYNCIKEHKLIKLPYIIIVWLGGNILLYVIPLMQEEFAMPPRMSFCFYLVQGLFAVIAYVICNVQTRKILSIGCVCYLVIQLLFSNFVVTNHFVSNTLDKVYVNMFYQEILKYEEETGNEVTKIAYRRDAYAPHNYEEVSYTSYEINERALGQVTNSLVWVVTGRKFENFDMTDEEYNKYFKDYWDKDWDYFDLSQQLVIDGNTAYWCIF